MCNTDLVTKLIYVLYIKLTNKKYGLLKIVVGIAYNMVPKIVMVPEISHDTW